ncbi:hypothetical protein ORI89_12095 [Sphingobacterium sp. UT-1RO-CII-1]|uniref:DUF7674 family protein n=1 Tax=Sphingobacterium sp. UT-1RO-CII-1 TaxID=2995225 RepID=UPI00227B2848|nr:hypothetical protein [Sphingobacterium sp. UT-1RO-CII-1]MCY4780396.1 hypothetical protein [Sphingobacterium sp. UT-1RO-CII-1]
MKTKISTTIRLWAPEAAHLIVEDKNSEAIADYCLLHKLAEDCLLKIRSGLDNELELVQKIVKVINLLYLEGNQYTRNAIENEFLTTLAIDESPGTLKKHLEMFPTELKKGYIKTILEN